MVSVKGFEREIKLTFFIPSNILNGAGGERCLFYYIKYAPTELFNITVIETNHYSLKRMNEEEIEEIRSKANWIQVKDIFSKFEFLANSTIGNIILLGVVSTFLQFLFRRFNREIIKKIANSDIIYLFVNDNVRLFKELNATIIGSNHGSFKKPLNFVNRVQAKFIEKGIFQRRIDGFHIFNGYEDDLHHLGKKLSFILPPRGIEDMFYKPRKFSDNKVRFLFVGRLEKYKGIEVLMDVWNYFEENDSVELHVVGTGALYSNLVCKKKKNVFLYGAVDNNKLVDIYNLCDVLIFPTFTEAYPLVILEALSYGLFVITSTFLIGLFDDYQKEGFLSYVKPNIRSLKYQIILILDKINLIRSNRERCHLYTIQKMNMKDVMNKFYNNLIEVFRYQHFHE